MSKRLDAMVNSIDDLPEGVIPTDGVMIIGYLDRNGDPGWALRTAGDGPGSSMIGHLEMAKHALMHRFNPTPCEE